jgi:hypothetical protein
MGAMLGVFISLHDGDEVLAKVETMRKMARESRQLSYLSSWGEKGDISGGQHG